MNRIKIFIIISYKISYILREYLKFNEVTKLQDA